MKFYSQNLREAFGETLVELGAKYPRLVVLDADLNTSSRTVLFKQRFPDRFIQCGIAESNMFGLAAGLATQGYVPVPSTFATFAAKKALDQVYTNIAYPNLNVKIPGSYAGMTATECGPSHNVAEDIAIMRALPNMRVLDLGDNHELRSAMHVMMNHPGPIYFRVPKFEAPELFDADFRFEFGVGQQLRAGRDVTLMSTGMMTAIALAAAELLAREGISATVAHLASIKPIDEGLILRCAKNTGAIVTIENHRVYGGFGSAVAEVVAREYPVFVDAMGLGDTVFESAPLPDLLRHHALTPQAMATRARALITRKGRT
jgi:transketolase